MIPMPVLIILAALLVALSIQDGTLHQYLHEMMLNHDGVNLK